MAEIVVSGTAKVFATLTVVMGLASHPVFKFQCRILGTVHVSGPFLADVQPPLSRQSTY